MVRSSAPSGAGTPAAGGWAPTSAHPTRSGRGIGGHHPRFRGRKRGVAGWYAGDDPWASIYGGPLRLAADARRFDVSPVWPAWLGQRLALDLLLGTGIEAIHHHDVALADRLRAGLGLPPGPSAIVSFAAPDGAAERLAAAGVVGAVRDGRLRLSCHLHNDEADVDRALEALVPARLGDYSSTS